MRNWIKILFFGFLISSCGSDIPDEITIGDQPRELVGRFCECSIDKNDDDLSECFDVIKEDFKATFRGYHGKDRTKFVQQMLHAFIEAECFQNRITSDQWDLFVLELNKMADD